MHRHCLPLLTAAFAVAVTAGQAHAHPSACKHNNGGDRCQLWANATAEQALDAFGQPTRKYQIAHRNVYVWTTGAGRRVIHFDTAGNITRTHNLPRHVDGGG